MDDTSLTITLVEQTESTNRLALEALNEGGREGLVFAADRQSGGRGRRHADGMRRRWFSPAEKNLYLSVVTRPDVAPRQSAGLTIAVGTALVEMLGRRTGVEVQLKWPNDLYVGARKLGGILTEAVTSKRGFEGAVVGIGLNVNVESVEFPDELRPLATSLVEHTDRVFDRLSLLWATARTVVDASRRFATTGLAPCLEGFDERDWLRGRRIEVQDQGTERSGLASGIGDGGGLIVDFDDGSRREIISGEVSVVDDCGTDR